MRREFNWAFSACVILGLLACGGDGRAPTAVVTTGGEGGGSGAAGEGGSGGSSNAGATGFIPDEPEAGAGGCSGECGGAGGTGGGSLCGNGVLDEGEQCDDGNPLQGDGCNGVCHLEPNFACDQPGEACVSTIVCGDGKVGGAEACDDGGVASGDGCSADCTVEPGFGCTTGDDGSVCIPIVNPVCGDSSVSSGEQCDDGDTDSGDGCSATCQVESGYVCPIVGQPCELVEYCGDGFLAAGVEECDDGNRSPMDGCNGECKILPNFVCPTPGQPCQSTIVCGDSQVTGNEGCDDGNTTPGDGCSATCVGEPGYSCTGSGPGSCTPVPEERCGDNALAASEFCDDGDNEDGDGCSATCTVEPGWDCTTGPVRVCTRVGSCGDSVVNVAGEQCDDGDNESGDGCTANCLQEALFNCPPGGGECTSSVVCGDGVVNGAETCDDGGHADTGIDDGCNASCQVKPGFGCPSGAACSTVCGDGIRAGREQCDDGGTSDGDGCDANCRLEDGFKCTDPASPASAPDVCEETVCGDGVREGTEQCDDGNEAAYDGCDPFCRVEPDCGGNPYTCLSECGDGKKFPDEECDDGNLLNGDGCSSNCELEDGFICTHDAAELGDELELPIVYRDFNSSHPQFEVDPGVGGRTPGMVLATLGTNGKPVYNPAFSADGRAGHSVDGAKPANGTATLNSSQIAARFAQWFVTDGTNNSEVLDFLLLDEVSPGVYQFARSGDGNYFFPLDGRGFNQQTSTANGTHNFHFTSEVRQWFTYDPSAEQRPLLRFSGDDDVWVFVNGRLAVDLGGIHGEITGSIELIGSTGQSSRLRIPANSDSFTVVNLPIDSGGVNEIAVFQAERHVNQSNYTLTLQGFNAPLTSCASDCGDGVQTLDEACDLGDALNKGTYGGCNADCTLAPRCGDGITQASEGEECDNGLNTSTRFNQAGDCAPGCTLPSRCGDGQIDGGFLEQCDDGDANTTPGTYGACGTNCQLGPRCGDGVVQTGEEQCDTGAANGTTGSPCLSNCTLRCGNGVVDQGEECDDGLANNTGGYGKCEATCTFGPRCGDAVVDSADGETCDDGLNDGSYGTCASNCQPGPFCGDGITQQSFGEVCDNAGANVVSGYAPGLCTTQCKPAPFCGDSAVNVANGEVCDDGVNDGSPGSCAPDCKSAIPLNTCGNGTVNAGEECDNGALNGTPGNPCDVRCQLACGNGFVDPTEQCDDGVNNGAYGTCNSNCTLAAFCGDGVTSEPEACDHGAANVPPASAYGNNVCTTTCALAPRCGDGRVDTAFGEACDGGPSCTSSCNILR